MNKNSNYTLGNTWDAVTVAINSEGLAVFRTHPGEVIKYSSGLWSNQIELGRPWHETKEFYDSLPGWDSIPEWVEFIAVDFNSDSSRVYFCNTNDRQVIGQDFINSQRVTLSYPRYQHERIATSGSLDDLEIKLSREWHEMKKEKASLIDWSKSPQWAIGHATLKDKSYWLAGDGGYVNVSSGDAYTLGPNATFAGVFAQWAKRPVDTLDAPKQVEVLVYTMGMHQRGELPPVGSIVEFIRETPFDIGKLVDHWDSGDQLEVICHSKGCNSLVDDIAVVRSSCGLSISLDSNYYRPIETRTDEQRTIDDLAVFESEHHGHRDYHLLLANAIVNGEIFGLGGRNE